MIGVFDSGIGGLTVVKQILKELPEYRLMYLGDTARMPYGNRSQDLIYRFTRQAVEYLFQAGCKLVIIACNTASAEALRKIQQEWLPKNYPDHRVLGVIRPIAQEVGKLPGLSRVGIIATSSTVKSGAYDRELKQINPEIKVFSQAAPLLVPLIEEGWQNRPETAKILRGYLRGLKNRKIQTLILGCTHYPILSKRIKNICGKKIIVLDTPKIVALSLKDYLSRHPEIETKLAKDDCHRFLVTDLTSQFKTNAENWLGQKINLEKIDLN
ncbi:MAG: glutamate racemase [Patescibacteria group bacterium]|jgi:glutamate racemase|nr:glutamate racemase [Patescibacteria group bacterium]